MPLRRRIRADTSEPERRTALSGAQGDVRLALKQTNELSRAQTKLTGSPREIARMNCPAARTNPSAPQGANCGIMEQTHQAPGLRRMGRTPPDTGGRG